jgi:hypothetical protein
MSHPMKHEEKEFILRLRVPPTVSNRDVARQVYAALEAQRGQYAYAVRYKACKPAPETLVGSGIQCATVNGVTLRRGARVEISLTLAPPCTCPAYPFPHARGYGKCKEPRV